MKERRFDIRVLAKRINERRRAFNARHANRRVQITDSLSRILEHDEEYVPLRRRSRNKERRLIQSPGIATLVDIADSLDTTVGDLLGEQGFCFTREDRRTLRWIVRKLTRMFALDDPGLGS